MDIKFTHEQKEKLILRSLGKQGAATANEIIDSYFKKDARKGYKHVVSKGWRFYVHLNKHYSVLESRGLILNKGKKKGPSGRMEKVWVLSAKAIKKYYPNNKRKSNIKLRIKQSVKRIREEAKKSKKTKKVG